MSSTGTVIFRGAGEDEIVKVKDDDASSGLHEDSDYEQYVNEDEKEVVINWEEVAEKKVAIERELTPFEKIEAQIEQIISQNEGADERVISLFDGESHLKFIHKNIREVEVKDEEVLLIVTNKNMYFLSVKDVEVSIYLMQGLDKLPLKDLIRVKRSNKNKHMAVFEFRKSQGYYAYGDDYFIITSKDKKEGDLITPLSLVIDKLLQLHKSLPDISCRLYVDESKDQFPFVLQLKQMDFNMVTYERTNWTDEQLKFGDRSHMHGVLRTKQPEAISKGFLGSFLAKKPNPALNHSEYYVLSIESGCLDVYKQWKDPKPRISIPNISTYTIVIFDKRDVARSYAGTQGHVFELRKQGGKTLPFAVDTQQRLD